MAYNFQNVKILILENSQEMARLIKNVLIVLNVPAGNIFSSDCIDKGFELFCKNNYDLLIVDWFEDNTSGISFTKKVRGHAQSPNRFVPIIITAGSGNKEKILYARDSGISEFLVKPFPAKTLADKITRAIEKPRNFTISDNYIGPDRRTKKIDFTGEDKREM